MHRLSAVDRLSTAGRLGLLGAAGVLLVVGYVLLYPLVGPPAGLLAVLPVSLAGWLFGLRGGVAITALVILPAYSLLLRLVQEPEWYAAAQGVRIGAILALLLLAAAVGLARESSRKALRLAQERARTMAEESESTLRLQMLVEQIPAVLWSTDRQLNYRSVGGAALARFPVAAEDLIGSSVIDGIMDPGQRQRALEGHQEALRGGRAKYEFSFRDNYFLVSVEPLRDAEGRVNGVLGLALDVTAERRAEQRLRQAQKLESLGVMAGGVAHDFNNLLVAILGHGSLALEKLPADSAAGEHLQRAMQAAEQARELAGQMLAFAGRERREMRPIDLNELVRTNSQLFEGVLPAGIAIETRLAAALPPVMADAGQLQQVVMNLLLNAAEAYPQGVGTVTLGTRLRLLPQEERAPAAGVALFESQPLPAGRYVELWVQDAGMGMDPRTAERIFEPFFTRKQTGNGLGLPVVLGIVQQLGGGVWVFSPVEGAGNGTRFELLLPAGEESSTAVDAAAGVDASEKGAAESGAGEIGAPAGLALIVDDDPIVRLTLVDMLELGGIRSLAAGDGPEALALYQQHMGEIRLVLLDLSMPGMSGDDVLRALRQIDPAARVAITSGYDPQRSAERPGVLGYLPKPYDAGRLLEFVRGLM